MSSRRVSLDSWTVHSKITILIIHGYSCALDPLFTEMIFPHQTEEVTGDSKLFCSIFSQQSWTASFFLYMWPHTDLQFIMLFLYLGVWRGIPVQLSQNAMDMYVYLHCSEWFTTVCAVFLICKPPLSTRLGLTQLFTIKQWEMLSTECEALGLSFVARKLRIDWPSGS